MRNSAARQAFAFWRGGIRLTASRLQGSFSASSIRPRAGWARCFQKRSSDYPPRQPPRQHGKTCRGRVTAENSGASDQGEEPGGERHAGTVMTKVQLARAREAKINGDQRTESEVKIPARRKYKRRGAELPSCATKTLVMLRANARLPLPRPKIRSVSIPRRRSRKWPLSRASAEIAAVKRQPRPFPPSPYK